MNSSFSSDSSADSKNIFGNIVNVIRDPMTGKILQAACGVAGIATAVSVSSAELLASKAPSVARGDYISATRAHYSQISAP